MKNSRGKEKRQYKKKDDLEDVKRWCALYPWYRNLVQDIRETLDNRDKWCGSEHRVVTSSHHLS